MGTIIERKSKTGGKRYTAQIRLKHDRWRKISGLISLPQCCSAGVFDSP